MSMKITYSDISRLLEGEAFRKDVVADSHVVFEHARSAATLLLPIHKPTAAVSPRHLGMVKQTLTDFGIMSETDVDRWIADPKHFQAV